MGFAVEREHVDLAQGVHRIVLRDQRSGVVHHVQIWINHQTCPTCGHVNPTQLDGSIDAAAIKKSEIATLNASHEQIRTYARKHGLKVLQDTK